MRIEAAAAATAAAAEEEEAREEAEASLQALATFRPALVRIEAASAAEPEEEEAPTFWSSHTPA